MLGLSRHYSGIRGQFLDVQFVCYAARPDGDNLCVLSASMPSSERRSRAKKESKLSEQVGQIFLRLDNLEYMTACTFEKLVVQETPPSTGDSDPPHSWNLDAKEFEPFCARQALTVDPPPGLPSSSEDLQNEINKLEELWDYTCVQCKGVVTDNFSLQPCDAEPCTRNEQEGKVCFYHKDCLVELGGGD